jgi:two-component system sensor histidine kinase ChvG
MKLKSKLLALSLLTLLLPWSAWKLLQELEAWLRESQETALLASARTISGALPLEFQSRLLFMPDLRLPLRPLGRAPVPDGYTDDWPDAEHGLVFESADGSLAAKLLAGAHGGRLYLLFDVADRDLQHAAPAAADGITLLLRSPRGLSRFTIEPEAPGPLELHSERGDTGQLLGYWLDTERGYRVELSLPAAAGDTDVSFEVRDAYPASGGLTLRTAGPLTEAQPPRWVGLVSEWRALSAWLADSAPADTRIWLVDNDGWVMADSARANAGGVSEPGPKPRTTWLQRVLYRLVAGGHTQLQETPVDDPVRLVDQLAQGALGGTDSVGWSQDLDSAIVLNSAAVPLRLQEEIRGAVVMQSSSEGLLLVTNRALGRLLLTTLVLALGLAAGLWLFASNLSRRVRRLSGAVSRAMDEQVDPDSLPLRNDRDELGDLARNNRKLLQAVGDYSQYLQTLAGKLSHELKTPLAITRSSLDNLASRPLDPESRRFLERAQEGVERQAAIVRAMSEASRLEAAIGAAEWDEIDLAELVRQVGDGHRSVYVGRRLVVASPDEPLRLRCAPDLLAQALDKLVDNAMSLSSPLDEVTVELRRREGRCELAVRNTGSTLPRELQDRLFDSLVSLREKRGGGPNLGLGLYIVRLVAEAHGGTVHAENLPGGDGVEFVIALPC